MREKAAWKRPPALAVWLAMGGVVTVALVLFPEGTEPVGTTVAKVVESQELVAAAEEVVSGAAELVEGASLVAAAEEVVAGAELVAAAVVDTGGLMSTPADLQRALAAARDFCWSAGEQDDWMHLVEVSMNAWLEQAHLKSVRLQPVAERLEVKQVRPQEGKALRSWAEATAARAAATKMAVNFIFAV